MYSRQKNGRCIAIVDPVGLWKSGGCWAYTADPNWEDKVERSIGEYAATHGGKQYQKGECYFYIGTDRLLRELKVSG